MLLHHNLLQKVGSLGVDVSAKTSTQWSAAHHS